MVPLESPLVDPNSQTHVVSEFIPLRAQSLPFHAVLQGGASPTGRIIYDTTLFLLFIYSPGKWRNALTQPVTQFIPFLCSVFLCKEIYMREGHLIRKQEWCLQDTALARYVYLSTHLNSGHALDALIDGII